MLTVQDIKDSFVRLKKDITDVPSTAFVEWVEFATQYAYENLQKIDPDRYISSESYAVVSSPSIEDLPDNFGNLGQTSCGLYLLDTEKKLGITGYGSVNKGYYLANSNIVFTGIENETYVMRYLPTRTTLSSLANSLSLDTTDTGIAIFEDANKKYLVKAVDVLYAQWDVDPSAESLADFRFVREMDNLFEKFRRTPHIAVMENTSNYF